MKRTLALDLGTTTGFCYAAEDGTAWPGTWELATTKEVKEWHQTRMDRRRDPRPERLLKLLRASHAHRKFELVLFEDVEFQTYTLQTQLWSSFRTAAWLAFDHSVQFECVPVGTLKKFATGHGGATKLMMAKAAMNREPNRFSQVTKAAALWDRKQNCWIDDNAVDAYHLYRWAEQNLSRI